MIKIYLDECCYGCNKALLDMNYEDSAMRYANGDHVGGRDYAIVCKKSDVCIIRKIGKNMEGMDND